MQEWDFEQTEADEYPLMLHYPYFELYRRQVVKQSDAVLAMLLRGDAFTADEKARNFAYYEARTVRDSSLSAPSQAVLAAEVGQDGLAHDYLGEAALNDLRSPGEKSGDGLHIAALAGCWMILVMGFGGLRDHDGELTFAPRLPSQLHGLRLSLLWRGARLRVSITPQEATYEISEGSLELRQHGEQLTLHAGTPLTRKVPALPDPGPRPEAPRHRKPRSRPDATESH